jgi:hypothetical protein
LLYISNIQNVAVHRTCTPLLEQYEATPYPTFLDPAETEYIYSGFVMAKTGPDTVALIDGTSTTAKPFGLSSLDRNTLIDDYTQTNNNSWTVWLGGVNASFQITAPAFDTSASYTVPTNGSRQYLYPQNTYTGSTQYKGQLTSVQGSSNTAGYIAVAELLDVLGPTTLVIRLVPFGAGL